MFADSTTDEPVDALLVAHQPDLVLILGDLQEWYLAPLGDWHGPKLGVYGNHCWPGYMEQLGIINLHMRRWQVGGALLAGFAGCHRYKAAGRFQYDQEEALALIKALPAADVLACHSPPNGINDHEDPAHQGLYALNWYLHAHQPQLLLHGHTYPTQDTMIGNANGTRIEYVHGARIVHLPRCLRTVSVSPAR